MELALSLLAIFMLRVVDVSLGVIRIVTVMRGRVWLAGLLGFFESLMWVTAASLVFANLDDPIRVVFFAGGFATGTIVGGLVERWMAIGNAIIRIVAPIETPQVAHALRGYGFRATVINAEGMQGEVRITFLVVRRRRIREVMRIIGMVNPEAMVTVEHTTLTDLHRRQSAAGMRK